MTAGVLIACDYFSFTNRIIRNKINNSAAFTGIVDSEGNIKPVSSDSISAKITAAFFSWVKYCVIPKGNYYEAIDIVNKSKDAIPK
ncbi:MAG: hypothetical protein N2490_03695 [Ignavibacteria bacterium]|nr:hypothetical protein [Ignavibacteria bacterium]